MPAGRLGLIADPDTGWPDRGGPVRDEALARADYRSAVTVVRPLAAMVAIAVLLLPVATLVSGADPFLPLVPRVLVTVTVATLGFGVALPDLRGRLGEHRARTVYGAFPLFMAVVIASEAALPEAALGMLVGGTAVLGVVVAASRGWLRVAGVALVGSVPLSALTRGDVPANVVATAVLAYGVAAGTVWGLRRALQHAISEEVDARLRSERRAEQIAAIAEGARTVDLRSTADVHEVVVALAVGLGWEMAAIYVVDGDELELATEIAVPEPSHRQRVGRREGLTGRAFDEGVTVAAADYGDYPGALVTAVQQVGTAVSTPIRANRVIVGVLSVASASARPLDAGDLHTLELLAAHAGRAFELAEQDAMHRRTIAELRKVERLKDDFLSTVSHEIRTPVTVILGGTETLATRWDDLEQRARQRLVENAYRNARALDEVIATLLDFARLEAGQLDLQFVEVDMAALAREVVGRLAPMMVHQDVTVEAQGVVRGYGDGRLLERVLENLLSNAAKYAGEGAAVRVTTRVGDDGVEVSVADDGPGIAAEDLARLGERFFRSGDVLTRGTRGVGIGLSFCRHVLALHDSRLDITSTLGEGSTFSFTLPRGGAAGS